MAGEHLSKMESSDDRSFLQVHLWHSTARKMTYPLFYLETIQAIRKLSTLSRNFPRCPEIFRIIRKISSLSGNFPGYPEIFRIIRKISSLSGNYLKGPETSQCNFKGYAQKLSGRAKTFRVAMPPCHPGFCASA